MTTPADQQQQQQEEEQRQARNRAEADRRIADPPPHHPCVLAPAPQNKSCVTADGDAFAVSAADRAAFERDGFLVLRGVMSDAELEKEIDPVFFGFFNGEPGHVAPGKDTCDMGYPPASSSSRAAEGAGPGKAPPPLPPLRASDCSLFNVMLPRLYYAGRGPGLIGGLLERRCASIAAQLRGWKGGRAVPAGGAAAAAAATDVAGAEETVAAPVARFAVDFDQILCKRPAPPEGSSVEARQRSKFGWHQDEAYWPPLGASAPPPPSSSRENDDANGAGACAQQTSAAAPAPPAAPPLNLASLNCWLAVSEASERHGCMRYLPGTHLEPALRPHAPVAPGGSRDESHAIHIPALENAAGAAVPASVAAPARRGDLVVHHERVVHCSPANVAAEWRHAYVLGFRTPGCIAAERAAGFYHSHNGAAQWDTWSEGAAAGAAAGAAGGGGG